MNTLWAWADVRDVAETHIAALMAEGKALGAEDRFFAAAGTYDYNEICKITERRFPELVREGGTPHSADPSETPYHYKVKNTRVKDELGVSMRDLEESIVDTVESLLDYEERAKRGETKEVILTPVVMSKGDDKGPEHMEAAENPPYSVGKGKTACRCGGNSGKCTCPPETCTCESCSKKTKQRKAGGKVGEEEAKAVKKATEVEGKPKGGQRDTHKKDSEEGAEAAKKVVEKVESQEQVDQAKKATGNERKDPGQPQAPSYASALREPSTKYAKLSGKIDCHCGGG